LQAFERELSTLLPRLRRLSRMLAGDVTDADDLLQVAIERALNARHQWQPGSRLDAWMIKIVRNCWIDELRSRKRRQQTFLPEEEGEHKGYDGHTDMERAAEMHGVSRALQELPPDQREVIGLVVLEGLSYREAAGILDVPIGTLTSRLNRGRQALTSKLEAI
jgi:RNA polymerase sigma factor (sigma-70 family)